jgi:hypothetical protein
MIRIWSTHFAAYEDTVRELDDLIKRNGQFLLAKLNMVMPEILKLSDAGSEVVKCDSCGLPAGII